MCIRKGKLKVKKNIVIKVVLQMVFVLLLLQIGNLLSGLLDAFIFIPGSIIGMMLLLLFLVTGIVKTNYIEELSGFLLKHMGFFYVPLGVSLLKSMDLFKSVWIELIAILFISCILVMYVTSKVTEILMNIMGRRKKDEPSC